ncbi:SDR family NAD(P)-dependent oxidoreductase [Paenibacillus doosanensis]|uniref:SDR family NAD(P)-dependent oxidoreductase n=1 Tax=Paenibacillus doosanensis TaxID=1229154 RepID=UPI00218081DF|nr:SDR family NAD(P)-dependent oxidoreductase [Paenibacillus doosanensis]MCS7464937.1 SDR family NAD(P)-dependent oxidoreductase [Paenibacillus doosanensis]
MKYFIITGTSRGIGLALIRQLLASGHTVLGISRSPARSEHGDGRGVFYGFEYDLSRWEGLEALMDRMLACIDFPRAQMVCLINNAAVIAPLSRMGECSAEAIAHNMQVNLLAPMILTSSFMERTRSSKADRRILNISSASVKHLISGMSCYTAAKAGLDTFARSVGLEQGDDGVRIASVWPGIIDTALQEEARGADTVRFPSAAMFSSFKDKGMLSTPDDTASKLISLLMSESFGNQPVIEQI